MAWTAPADEFVATGRGGLARLSRVLLWLTVFSGGFVLFEPAPYEGVFSLLLCVILLRAIAIPRILVLPAGCIALWLTGGILAVAAMHGGGVEGARLATVYLGISIYLGLSTLAFATLAAQRPEETIRTVRGAYVAAALIAALTAILAYFHLVPGAEQFLLYGRAKGTFKDPNVFAPFLVLPALLLSQDVLKASPGRLPVVATALAILLAGSLLSFSRAAWAHLMLSELIMAALLFATSRTNRFRLTIVAGGLGALCLGALVIAGLLEIPAVAELFRSRADLLQDYDSGVTGRFGTQIRSLPDLLEAPLGFGPYGFGIRYGQDPHNVYLNAFAAYGWLGGFGYIAFALATWLIGGRMALRRTPWQSFHIAAFAAYAGATLEGLVIDTDHWRHYFLLAGLVWGLSAATLHHYRQRGRTGSARAPD